MGSGPPSAAHWFHLSAVGKGRGRLGWGAPETHTCPAYGAGDWTVVVGPLTITDPSDLQTSGSMRKVRG
jgi:hypothetical protein